jgi:hypothetical protein
MVLSLNSGLRTVFAVYGAFWVTVLVVLFIGVGALIKRQEKLAARNHDANGGH